MTQISWKRFLASLHDAVMAALALFLALVARYGIDELLTIERFPFWLAGFVLTCVVVFRLFGLGRGMWRFASITDLRAIVFSVTLAITVFVAGVFAIDRLVDFPRSAPLVTWFVLIVLLGAPRLAYRAFKDGGVLGLRPRDHESRGLEHLLILGSASEADKIIRGLNSESGRRFQVHGIVGFNRGKEGRDVHGVPIVGHVGELSDIVQRLGRGGTAIDALILAGPRGDAEVLRTIAAYAAELRLPLRRVRVGALADMKPDLTSITLDDLLGRPPVSLDLMRTRALVEGRVVLVTGAGGSIGSEIVRQIAALGPARLILLDSSEYALYEVDQCMARDASGVDRRCVIADIRNKSRIDALFEDESPSVVFHAAALKHVPLVEANPCEGALTNAIGTRSLVDAAVKAGVDAFVMISTDKAIRPTSVMGATKRAAEIYCQAMDTSGVVTRFITVRFGNVLGSTGSVVPLFKRQIAQGGPITITHPEMKRYFMTIKEATELVLQAAAYGVGRDDQRGMIFVLDMGEPVRIVDLARTMIALSGLKPDRDIGISFTGLRPGEKLFEELFDKDEPKVPSDAEGVFVASARHGDIVHLGPLFDALEEAAREGCNRKTLKMMMHLVPDLAHAATESETRTEAQSIRVQAVEHAQSR